jgi:hypothetical protein
MSHAKVVDTLVGAIEELSPGKTEHESAADSHCDKRGDECCGVTADRKSAAVSLIYELLGALGALGAEAATAEERQLAPVSGCDEDAQFAAAVVARRADEAAKAGEADEADEADEAEEADEADEADEVDEVDRAANATVTDKVKVAGRCTDHGALSCRADGAGREGSADRECSADRAKKPAGAATGPPVTKRRGSKRGKGHKPAVMPWTPEHREALYIAALAVGGG